MIVKTTFVAGANLVGLCKRCGCAPCQVLVLNNARSEAELVGRTIDVPVVTSNFVRSMGTAFVQEWEGDQLRVLVSEALG